MGDRRTPKPVLIAVTIGFLTACSPEDRQAPTTAGLVIEKALEQSGGDAQVGVAGQPLPRDLRARVTRDGEPVEGVTVYWTTMQGSMNPEAPQRRRRDQRVEVDHAVLLPRGGGLRQPGPGDRPQGPGLGAPGHDHVHGPRLPRSRCRQHGPRAERRRQPFEPANITITVGDTVNWYWPVGSAGHNIVPDDDVPATSGAPAGYPKFLSFTFAIPGVYHYHCAVHGGPGGVGMSGVVTVLPLPPRD